MSAALVARLTKAFENVRYIKESSGFRGPHLRHRAADGRRHEQLCRFARLRILPHGARPATSRRRAATPRASRPRCGSPWRTEISPVARCCRTSSPNWRAPCAPGIRATETCATTAKLVRLAGYPIGDPRPPFFFAGDARQGGRRAHGPDHAFVRRDPLDQPGEGRRRVVRATRSPPAPAGSAAGRSRLRWCGPCAGGGAVDPSSSQAPRPRSVPKG